MSPASVWGWAIGEVLVHDHEAEMGFKRVEVSVTVEQRKTVDNGKGSDQAVDGLPG